MSQKRQQQDDATKPCRSGDGGGGGGGSGNSDDKRRRLPNFRSVVQEVMNICKVQNFVEPVLEPLIRKVVKEEVESAFKKYLNSMKRNCGKDMQTSETRSLRLQFQSTISLPVFTGSRIEGEDCNNLRVALVDSLTGQVVSSGAGCSAKVEIIVLEGDFDGDEGDNWTVEEFKNNIVKEREGKKALLTGDVFLTLNDGIGVVADISFTDNSSWTRSRKFRLGARVVDNCHGIRVKEAKTESFVVRDHRGELYKKHHPPSLGDEVWRLEKIGKDGAFHKRLSKERVFTVKDFLILLSLDPARLRNILGTGMSAKMWEVTIDHARTCVLDDKVYVYYPSTSQQKIGVVFNIVGHVLGLLSDDRYIAPDKMSETEKDDARNLVITAFRHSEDVISFDDEASFMEFCSRLPTAQYSSDLPMAEGDSDVSKALTSQKFGRSDNPQLSASSPDLMSSIYSVDCLDDYGLHGIDSMDVRFDQTLNFPCPVANTFSCDADFLNQTLYDDGHLHNFDPFSLPSSSLESTADLQSSFVTHKTGGYKAQQAWRMLCSVLRWWVCIRRLVKKTHPGITGLRITETIEEKNFTAGMHT